MSNGSMQFLGRQLAEQAIQLGLLVDKITENTLYLMQSVPKFAIPTTNVKKIIDVNYTGANTSAPTKEFTSYMSGKVRIYTTGKATVTAEAGYKLNIFRNGVSVGVGADIIGLVETTNYIDVFVEEFDKIEIKVEYYYSGGAIVNVKEHKIAYDLEPKPDIIL